MFTRSSALLAAVMLVLAHAQAAAPTIETAAFSFRVADTGAAELVDKIAGVTWRSATNHFGEATLLVDGKPQRIPLTRCATQSTPGGIQLTFHPLTNSPQAAIHVNASVTRNAKALNVSWSADAGLAVDSIRLLDTLFATTGDGYVVIPAREGLLIPANSGRAFTNRFETYAYEGCHMAMFGLARQTAGMLVTWDDPYVTIEVRSTTPKSGPQTLLSTPVLKKTANSLTLHPLGKAGYVDMAKAYREVAREKGWFVTLDQKAKTDPNRTKLEGASNVKLWSTLSRRMDEESKVEQSARVNWTFDEAAKVAEHLKRDLQMDKVLFTMGGWIHRGYDNQHPDILPAAPECGGDRAFADCSRRILDLGYLLCLHDNYQDIYRDSPSWDERFIQKNAAGKITRGGHWAGGLAYITCSEMALELAKRPQNLTAVKKLSNANAYFIDTTYAAGLQECFDKDHPLTRSDDMKWKQSLSDYARNVFGVFGSECGREWAIPHADFFEGLTGVSGKYYHNLDPATLGASVIPLFELVYRDCIAMYGKYGYDPMNAAEYVLHHIAIGRPLNYHSIPAHLYWEKQADERLPLRASVANFKQTGPRQFTLAYDWTVSGAVTNALPVFVHFTDARGKILFQGDYRPKPAINEWQPGHVNQGPFPSSVPAGVEGTFDVRVGFHDSASGSRRAMLGEADSERRYLLGQISIAGTNIQFRPFTNSTAGPKADRSLFCLAENGWAQGMNTTDRFLKNTHEILSPLHEITARLPMTSHQFLDNQRKVQRTVFGDGAVTVTVNLSTNAVAIRTAAGGSAVLPELGFFVESPTYIAFHVTRWNENSYRQPTLFTLRSSDGLPLASANSARVFHGFGESHLDFRGKHDVKRLDRVALH